MKLKFWFHKQEWRSPDYKFVLFNVLLHRHSLIMPRVISYSFELVLFGIELEISLWRKK